MLHSLNRLLGASVRCLDDEFGSLYNALVIEKTWTLGYFVIQTGSWLQDRRVLIAPTALRTPFWSDGLVFVDLTREQILNSPPVDAAKPVSRQQEELMNAYFGWPAYWSPNDLSPPLLPLSEGPSSLRSLLEVRGYRLTASDGEVGKVVDLIGDEPDWNVPYLVIETGGLLSRKRFCPSRFITGINWAERLVCVSVRSAEVAGSPDPPSFELPDPLFAMDLDHHYGLLRSDS